MATPDYSKIWGVNSPLAKYEFTEADYLRGWEFIGSMPPARTMFDAWMRKADEKMRWLYDNAFSENSLGGFLFWRLPDTAYFVGEKRALQDGPLDVYIECTIAGRTSKEQMKKLPQGAEIGKTFVDGTATWLVRQFTTSAALDDHRKKTPLDHPDGSVLKKHLGFEVYDKGEVYSKNEINQSYRKIGNRIVDGDVDWNTLNEATTYKIQNCVMDAAHHAPPNEYNFGLLIVNRLENGADDEWRTVQIYFPHSTRGYWSRMYNGPADYRAGNWVEWRYIPTHNEVETIAEQKTSTKVSKSGDTMSGRLTLPSILANDWFRALGTCGFYFEDHGGGWHMTDNDWIRAFNGKNIYTSGKMRCDAGFEGNLRGTADNANVVQNIANDSANMRMHWNGQGGQPAWLWGGNDPHNMYVWNPSNFRVANANTVGDKSLQWILEQISAAKTGIVNGNLEQNGWVKFANGLIIQWLYNATPSANGIAFPITFSYKCFAVFSNRTNNTHSGDVCSTHVHSFTNSWVKVWSGKTDEAMNFGSYYKVNILAVGI